MAGSRIHDAVATRWPFGGRAEKPAAFEHVHLPDEGQEFLKPPVEMLRQEMGDSADPDRKEALIHFQDAEEKFKTWKYRDASSSYLASYDTWDSLSALLARGVALMMVSDLRDAAGVFEAGQNLAQQRQDARFEAVFGINLGQVYNDLGEPDRALEALQGAQDLCREVEESVLEAMALRHLGMVMLAQASYAQASACCEQAIRVSEQAKDARSAGHVLCNKGIILMSKGDLRKAEEIFQQGLMKWLYEDMYVRGRIFTNLATLYLIRGNLQEATSISERALEIYRSVNYRHGEARNLGTLAVLQIAQGNTEEGHRTFNKAVGINRELGYRRGEIRELLTMARIYLQNAQTNEARHLFQIAHDLAGEINHGHIRAETSAMLVLLLVDAQIEEKISKLKDVMTLSRSIRCLELEIQIFGHLGLLYANAGRFDEAVICCQQAVMYSREKGNLFEKAKSLMNLAYVQDQQGEKELAAENRGIAQALFQSQGIGVGVQKTG